MTKPIYPTSICFSAVNNSSLCVACSFAGPSCLQSCDTWTTTLQKTLTKREEYTYTYTRTSYYSSDYEVESTSSTLSLEWIPLMCSALAQDATKQCMYRHTACCYDTDTLRLNLHVYIYWFLQLTIYRLMRLIQPFVLMVEG